MTNLDCSSARTGIKHEPHEWEGIDFHFCSGFSPAPPSILSEADSIIHGDRNQSYGNYERECERIAKGWSLILGTEVQPRLVPLMMIWLKTSRELHKHKRDNLVDLCGYAALLDEMENAE